MPGRDLPQHDPLAGRKLRTAMVLVSVALAFFIGIIIRAWILNK